MKNLLFILLYLSIIGLGQDDYWEHTDKPFNNSLKDYKERRANYNLLIKREEKPNEISQQNELIQYSVNSNIMILYESDYKKGELDITILNSTHDPSEIVNIDYTIEIRNIDDKRELIIN